MVFIVSSPTYLGQKYLSCVLCPLDGRNQRLIFREGLLADIPILASLYKITYNETLADIQTMKDFYQHAIVARRVKVIDY
jgi:hypothetical protein